MAQWIDKESLKAALTELVRRGDERWASKEEGGGLTPEDVREIANGEIDTRALSEDDLIEIIQIINGT